jgi:glycosyltransferase involved in cell wall biosynthesis
MGLRAYLQYWPSGTAVERFDAKAPVALHGSRLVFHPDDIVVLPEGWRKPLNHFAARPCRKILHCQNPYYVYAGVDTVADYQKLGIEQAIVCSAYTGRYLTELGFSAPIHVVRPALDRAFTQPASGPKERRMQIAFMPRKLGLESRYVQGLFKVRYPKFADIPWVPISGMGLAAVADVLSESTVFAAFGHLEGLGLPPLEAMARGCVVAGFHGGGGLEYAKKSNGFWAESGDLEGCAQAIADAVGAVGDAQALGRLQAGMQETVADYTEGAFELAFQSAWSTILGDRGDRFMMSTARPSA